MQLSDDDSGEDEGLNRFCHCPSFGKAFDTFLFWRPKKDNILLEFLRESTVHGLKYIGQHERRCTERIFWLLSFIASVIVSGYLINDAITQLYNSPVIISFQPSETTVDQIPFPSFTVCNVNKIKRSAVNEFVEHEMKRRSGEINSTDIDIVLTLHYIQNYCEASESFRESFNYSTESDAVPLAHEFRNEFGIIENATNSMFSAVIQPLLKKSFNNCYEMILLCIWSQEEVPCDELFSETQTEFGDCCTFNMVPDFILRKFPQNISGSEFSQRMSPETVEKWSTWHIDKRLVTDDEVDESYRPGGNKGREYSFPRHQMKAGMKSGLSILLNPQLDEYFCPVHDSVGFRAEVHSPIDYPHVADFGKALSPGSEVLISIEGEVTIADDDVYRLNINERQCYYMEEYGLKFSKFYTQRNCIDECVANITYKTCHCVRFFMPKSTEQGLCSSTDWGCPNDVKKTISDKGIQSSCPMCLPACDRIEYTAQITNFPLRNDVDLWVKPNGESEKWSNQSVSVVHVFFGSNNVQVKVRKNLYGILELLGNSGGLLGLTLGISIISLIEPFYFFTLWIWLRRRSSSSTKRDENRDLNRKSKLSETVPPVSIWTIHKPAAENILKYNSIGFPVTKIMVNPTEFVRWSDPYSKNPARNPHGVKFPLDFIRRDAKIYPGFGEYEKI